MTRPNSVSARRCPSVTAHSAGRDAKAGHGSPAMMAGWPAPTRPCPVSCRSESGPPLTSTVWLTGRVLTGLGGGSGGSSTSWHRAPIRASGIDLDRRVAGQDRLLGAGGPRFDLRAADRRPERGDPGEPGQGQGLVHEHRGGVAHLPRVQVVPHHDVSDAGPLQVPGQAADLLAGLDRVFRGGQQDLRSRAAVGHQAELGPRRAGQRHQRVIDRITPEVVAVRVRGHHQRGVQRRPGGQERGGLIPVPRHRGKRARGSGPGRTGTAA